MSPPGGHVRAGVGDGNSVPVVPAPGGLDDERPADSRAEFLEGRLVVDAGPRGTGHAHRTQALAHRELVLGVAERIGGRLDAHATRGLTKDGVRDVLVLEGQDVGPLDEGGDGLPRAGLTDGLVDGDLAGRPVLSLNECPQVYSERYRTLLHHACQLSPADDGNGYGCRYRACHGTNLPLS